jgi:glycosyltransferase involved in cell wall biosynthesis
MAQLLYKKEALKKIKILLENFYSSITSAAYSKLFFVGDNVNWVLNWEVCEIKKIAKQLGISAFATQDRGIIRQSIFYASKYILMDPQKYLVGSNNIAFSYFHGYPSSGEPTALQCYQNFKKYHNKISRVQVSHSHMKNVALDSGIEPSKVFLIPIAINHDFFHPQSNESKQKWRAHYGVPSEAVVVGSFQKDGSGWGEGMEPKLIKGPDIFLKTIEILKNKVPDLFVLLSGPARGYVKAGLESLKVPYKHVFIHDYPEIDNLYQCIDVYIVASREEGGPKAVLESMACGVPLVTTRVGQAMDLVNHKHNGMISDVEDFEGLAFCVNEVLSDSALNKKVVTNGCVTADQNTYNAHIPLWKEFFQGFVHIAN